MNDRIKDFETHLETQIKSCFREAFRSGIGSFKIAPNSKAEEKLNDILANTGLSVYGMEVTQDAFTVICEFNDALADLHYSVNTPKYCSFALDNDGLYEVTICEDDLDDSWYTSIRSAAAARFGWDSDALTTHIEKMFGALVLTKLGK